ncbi:MAG: YbaK/EbsC family protein [Pseudomonadota bacterium]
MNAPPFKPATQRVIDACRRAGLNVDVVQHGESTRTAEDAARACGCAVGQIIKSLVFQRRDDETPVLLLVAGDNRVNEKAVAGVLGAALKRPDAAYVRSLTGYAIGGIPPLGHATPLATFMDEALLVHARVWAAAGTPDTVFAVDPAALRDAVGATVLRVA